MTQIELVYPFPDADWAHLWNWVQEYPERNFDDYGPRDCADFIEEMRRRQQVEWTFGVRIDGVLGGFVGFAPTTPRSGMLHGICFAQRAWGPHTRPAVRRVFEELATVGVEKISATYFADNAKIDRFLKDLGAQEEGLLRQQTRRGGELIDMRLVGIFLEESCH